MGIEEGRGLNTKRIFKEYGKGSAEANKGNIIITRRTQE